MPRNTITYNAAIQACANGLAWQQALALFDRMKSEGIERDRVTYKSVIRACERAGEYKLAFDVRMQAAEAMGDADGEWTDADGDGAPAKHNDANRQLLREQRD